jgi:hypothetical protein
MEFTERLNALSNKIKQQLEVINTEEATKTAFVMPFIHNVLGYDVFDPQRSLLSLSVMSEQKRRKNRLRHNEKQ